MLYILIKMKWLPISKVGMDMEQGNSHILQVKGWNCITEIIFNSHNLEITQKFFITIRDKNIDIHGIKHFSTIKNLSYCMQHICIWKTVFGQKKPDVKIHILYIIYIKFKNRQYYLLWQNSEYTETFTGRVVTVNRSRWWKYCVPWVAYLSCGSILVKRHRIVLLGLLISRV